MFLVFLFISFLSALNLVPLLLCTLHCTSLAVSVNSQHFHFIHQPSRCIDVVLTAISTMVHAQRRDRRRSRQTQPHLHDESLYHRHRRSRSDAVRRQTDSMLHPKDFLKTANEVMHDDERSHDLDNVRLIYITFISFFLGSL